MPLKNRGIFVISRCFLFFVNERLGANLFGFYVIIIGFSQVWRKMENRFFCSGLYLLFCEFLHQKRKNVHKMPLAKVEKLA